MVGPACARSAFRELRILELRKHAEATLGPAFDIRDFHDALLLSGGVTLDLLEDIVEGYIREAEHRTSGSGETT